MHGAVACFLRQRQLVVIDPVPLVSLAVSDLEVENPIKLPFCGRNAVEVQHQPRPMRQGAGSQTGWPLACEELMVKTHPSGPMTSNES